MTFLFTQQKKFGINLNREQKTYFAKKLTIFAIKLTKFANKIQSVYESVYELILRFKK